MGRIPYTPYYGTVDATPLFLIVLAEYTNWAGDLSLFRELRGAVEAALRWIDDYGDHDGDGYLDYASDGGARLINQGWKDAGGSIIDSRGRVAEAPIALVEVQGYVYRARCLMAELFQRDGDGARATALRDRADALRERFNRDFWMEDAGYYALALERGGRQVDAISSNPAHAIWTGIIDRRRLDAVVERLMADDMYSGWGVRTLSTQERGYNPVGYHLGTVWPHDNAFIAAGLRAEGFNDEACRIFAGLLAAARHFEHNRLPELFAGYAYGDFQVPVRYPVACHPQAWAAGSIPHLLQAMLGLRPDALAGRLRVVNPTLPKAIDRVELEHVRCGGGEVTLRFERKQDGDLAVDVERVSGDLDVSVESD
jgi:glycogen debranching enzyme